MAGSPPRHGGGHLLLGIALAVAGFGLFAASDALVKSLRPAIPVAQIVAIIAAVALAVSVTVAALTGGLGQLRTDRRALHLLRGTITSSIAYTAFFALGRLPLAEFYAIVFSAPLIVALLSPLLLGEAVGLRRWLVTLVGFSGILIIVRPGGAPLGAGTLAAFGTALSFGLAMMITRRMGPREPAVCYAAHAHAVALMISLVQLPVVFVPMPPAALAINVTAGLAAACAVLCVTWSFRTTPSSIVAPFQYTQMVWGVLIGLFAFGEWPAQHVWLGAVVIVASGLYLLIHDTRQRRATSVHGRSGSGRGLLCGRSGEPR